MNTYQIVKMLKEDNYEAFISLKKRCEIEDEIDMVFAIDNILSNSFDMNVKTSTCEKVVAYIKRKELLL